MKNSSFWFLVIFVAAAVFRLTNLGLIEFKADEAINLFLTSRPLFGHPFPPGGTVSSVGILNPPLFNYLLFPLVNISTDPRMVSFFIALINCLAIGFFFLLIRHYFNQLTALIAASLFAFSPWAILFSRKIWSQNLLVPFVILLFWCLLKIVKEEKQNYWWLLIALILLIIQLHQAAIIFIFLLAFFFLLKCKSYPSRFQIFLGMIIGLLPLLPYLIYVLKNLANHPEAIIVNKAKFAQVFHPLIFLRPLQILNQGSFYFVLGPDTLTFQNRFPLVNQVRKFFYLEYLLLPFGLFIFWRKEFQFRFLPCAILGLPLIYFLLHFEPFIHYFLIILPFLFLFLASGLTYLIQLKNHWLRLGTWLTLFGLITISIIFDRAFFQLLKEQKGFKGDYGQVFEITQKAARDKLTPWQNDPHYQEMVLASYLPRQYWYGNLPVPLMLYSYEKTQARLTELENRLRAVPEDARVQNELIALYTASPPTPELINSLKEKAMEIPGYLLVWQEVEKFFNKDE